MAQRWNVIINQQNVVDAAVPLLNEKITQIREELARQVAKPAGVIEMGISNIVLRLIAKEASRAVILNGISEEFSSILNQEGWIDIGDISGGTGTYGTFMETDVFGMTQNSDPRADIRGFYATDTGDTTFIETELKTMLQYQDTIHIGTISVLREIIDEIKTEADRIKYKNDVILYKMLLKMQNFILARTQAMQSDGRNYIRFTEISAYSKIIVEYVEQVINEFRARSEDMIKVKAGTMDKKLASTMTQGNLFSIKETSTAGGKGFAGLVKFELTLEYKNLIGSDRQTIDGQRVMVENYKKMYREKTTLFNTPETRKRFFAIARRIAGMAHLEM